MNSGYAKRVVSLGASTVAPVGVALWPRGFLGKRKRGRCVTPKGCKFTKVKATEQNYG